ncbi:peptidyl-prolyl cis-trans isomerase [Pseudomonadota bacterium]
MSSRLTRLFKEPLLQFLIIGAAIYGAYALFASPEDDYRDNTILVDANRINVMISEWEARWSRSPTRQEIEGLIQAYIKEDVLYRQAVTMGLNEDDPITRRRMAQKLEFLTSDLASFQQPAEGELKQFFEENLDSYRDPDLISFTQIFINPDARGDATLVDAAQILEQVRAAGEPTEETSQLGDRFMLQNYFAAATELDIRRQLGSGFAEQVMKLEPGQWHGPVLSGYGVHLVYVYDFQEAAPPVLENVQDRVREDWLAMKRDEFNAEFLKSLKDRYEIIIEELPADRLLDTQIEAANEEAAAAANIPVEADSSS